MKARVFIYLVVAIGLLVTTLDIENIGEGASNIPSVERQIYEVTIEGSVGNLPFTRAGSMFIVKSTSEEMAEGQNRINIWLISGNPNKRGEQGAITLATNNRFYVNGALQDFALTTARNFTIDAHFDSEISQNQNAFSFNGLTFETLSIIESGDLHIELIPGGEIEGTILLTGLNPTNGQVAYYLADFHGQYLATQ